MPGFSKTNVFNIGFGHLAVKPAAVDTEATVQAGVFSRVWDFVRRTSLAQTNWGFARVPGEALTIAAGYTAPANYLYAYQYPVKAIAVWKVYNPALVSNPSMIPDVLALEAQPSLMNIQQYLDHGEPFAVVFNPATGGKIILTNCPDALCEYTYDMQDSTLWSDAFVQLMGYGLAAEGAMPLVGDPDMQEKMSKAYLNAASEAKRLNKAEDNSERFGSGSTVDSRS